MWLRDISLVHNPKILPNLEIGFGARHVNYSIDFTPTNIVVGFTQ